MLGIEIDGSVYDTDEAKEYNLNRKAEIENLGITILRFSNQQVLYSISGILEEIQLKANEIQQRRRQGEVIKAGFFQKAPHPTSAPFPLGEGPQLLIFRMNCDSYKFDYLYFYLN